MTTSLDARPASRRTSRWIATAALAVSAALLTSVSASAQDDSNLDQDIADDQPVVQGEQQVLTAGHVDLGPRFVDGAWTFLVHDDAAKADPGAASVWRYPDEVVLHVTDDGMLSVPDDPAYDFLDADPGENVWVVPQTQDAEVVWIGWNTQDPEVMQTIDRGITLSLSAVQGPGTMTTYLQSGTFGEPQVLFDSRTPESQPVWVDVNTHTHANWVFSEPGVYLVQLTAEADLVDGSQVSDTQVVRIAVGSGTSPETAFAATWEGGEPDAASDDDTQAASDESEDSSPLVPILVGTIAVVAVLLVIGFTVAIVRGNRTRREVLAARGSTPTEADA